MKAYSSLQAAEALALWRGGAAAAPSLERIATAGNDVWRFEKDSVPFVLRLTHARVAQPVPSESGALVETVGDASASVFTWADGDLVLRGDPRWDEPFFREWGRALARLHAAAARYEGAGRWDWGDEGLLRDADALLPASDDAIRAQRDELFERLSRLPRTRDSFGLIHADFGPQNFRVGPDGAITAFDFGNLCRHWFAYDMVIALSVLRAEPDRDRLRAWLLAGYEEVRPLDPAAWAERDTLLRLRVLYVYLSRLKWFGPAPTPEQRGVLAALRALVLERVSWR